MKSCILGLLLLLCVTYAQGPPGPPERGPGGRPPPPGPAGGPGDRPPPPGPRGPGGDDDDEIDFDIDDDGETDAFIFADEDEDDVFAYEYWGETEEESQATCEEWTEYDCECEVDEDGWWCWAIDRRVRRHLQDDLTTDDLPGEKSTVDANGDGYIENTGASDQDWGADGYNPAEDCIDAWDGQNMNWLVNDVNLCVCQLDESDEEVAYLECELYEMCDPSEDDDDCEEIEFDSR